MKGQAKLNTPYRLLIRLGKQPFTQAFLFNPTRRVIFLCLELYDFAQFVLMNDGAIRARNRANDY
jgi:hypothetical protein